MKIKTLLLVIAAAMAAGLQPSARSQELVQQVSGYVNPDGGGYGGYSGYDPAASTAAMASYEATAGYDPAVSYALQNPYDPARCPAEDFSCSDALCGQCNSCCRRLDIFGSAELLMWWTKGSSLPPLVTTSPPGTPQVDAGVLSDPDTVVLFGNQQAGQEMQIGGRAILGLWLDQEHNVAAAGRFYGLGGDTTSFAAASDGNPILARPFFNAFLGVDDALLIAFPGLVEGRVQAEYEQFNFLGAEAYLEIMMHRDRCRRLNLLMGYHILRMDDRLEINSLHTITSGPVAGTTIDIFDRFATQNEFHGGMIGFRSVRSRGRVSLDSLFKLSLGDMRQHVEIDGQTIVNGAVTPDRGLLAQPSNVGEFERHRFVAIPELTMNLKYHFNPRLSAHIGYNLIWISNAVTAGEQIDLNVNPNQPIGPAVPVFQFNDENYWVQGINFGVNFDF